MKFKIILSPNKNRKLASGVLFAIRLQNVIFLKIIENFPWKYP